MDAIPRDLDSATARAHDVAILGGGVYGTMLMYEAARRDLRALLVEKSDFGCGTSLNNLRIVHGGLRYLQSLHLSRFRESVAERRWFLTNFPDLVNPLPCLMPLYGGVLRNRALLRLALSINDFLSAARNKGVPDHNHLPGGTLLDAGQTRHRFPAARSNGLRGAAMWYDAVMPDCRGILVATIRDACRSGGIALNRVEATALLRSGDRVTGIVATDHVSGERCEFRANAVINATGPDVDRVNRQLGLPGPELFIPSLAWNLRLDREPLSDGAVALEPPGRGARVYFAHALEGKLIVGTGHSALPRDSASTKVPDSALAMMLEDLNAAVPQLQLRQTDILSVLSGQLPVRKAMSTDLCSTADLVRHSAFGGPVNAISISGVKFTTARSTAEKTIKFMTEKRIL